MPQRKPKISDTDLQLYLTEELVGEKKDIIAKIDAASVSELNSNSDRRVKETLSKLRYVNQVFERAAADSYPMPAEFESELEQVLSSKFHSQKKSHPTILDKVKEYFTASNLWSLAGGGAVASLAFAAIITINPLLLVDPKNFAGAPVFRGVETPQSSEKGCALDNASEWISGGNFLVTVQICGVNGQRASLKDGARLKSGDSFSIFVLPLKSIKMGISYREQDGNVIILKQELNLKEGALFSMTDVGKFETSLGEDSFIFEPSPGAPLSIALSID